MAFRGQQARGRIEPDPAGAGQIDLGPGVEVSEVVVGAGWAVERDEIGLELDEIAGHEAGGQAQVAENLHQKPARIAARAGAALECLLRGLNPRFHPDEILNFTREAPVEIDHKIDGANWRSINPA